jgi:hypothetical protein
LINYYKSSLAVTEYLIKNYEKKKGDKWKSPSQEQDM